jgi:hypothetical protein
VKDKASRELNFELRSFYDDEGELYDYTSFTKCTHDLSVANSFGGSL